MNDIVTIKNWRSGIGDYPSLGMGNLKNVNVVDAPGSVMPAIAPEARYLTPGSTTFTADAATDTITLVGDFGQSNNTGVAVTLTTTGTLPAGLATGTTYFIVRITSTTLKLATTYGNSQSSTVIDITDAGTGTHTITSVPMGIPRSMDRDSNGNLYMLDSNGRVWFLDSSVFVLMPGNTLTGASGLGLKSFTNSNNSARYILVFRNDKIDIMNVSTSAKRYDPIGTSSWTNSWISLNTGAGVGNSHQCIVGQDNIIYYCDDRYIGSIREIGIFDPTSGGTYNSNTQALDLPQGEVAESLEELGQFLLVGGKNTNKIYPWDRISTSFTLPLVCSETGILKMKNINNMVYILAGTKGYVYTTNGSFVNQFKKIPEHLINAQSVTWGGIESFNGDLIFGFTTGTVGGNLGVYRLTPQGVLTIDKQPSAGSAGATVLIAFSGGYYLGSSVSSVGAVDSFSVSRYAAFEAIVESELFALGTKTKPVKISEIEVQIANAINSASIRLSYRRNLSGSYTTITTFGTTNDRTSYKTDSGITDIENLQIKAELSGSSSGVDALQMLEIRLIP